VSANKVVLTPYRDIVKAPRRVPERSRDAFNILFVGWSGGERAAPMCCVPSIGCAPRSRPPPSRSSIAAPSPTCPRGPLRGKVALEELPAYLAAASVLPSGASRARRYRLFGSVGVGPACRCQHRRRHLGPGPHRADGSSGSSRRRRRLDRCAAAPRARSVAPTGTGPRPGATTRSPNSRTVAAKRAAAIRPRLGQSAPAG